MDFHWDLFPDEFISAPAVTAAEWLDGSTKIRDKTSMDPAKQPKKTIETPKTDVLTPSEQTPTTKTPSETPSTISTETPKSASQSSPSKPDSTQTASTKSAPVIQSPTPLSRDYTRKFLTGRLLHLSTHYTSLPPHPTTTSLNRTLTTTSSQILFPLSGPGGRIALLSLSNPGRHETPPTFSTGAPLVDFEARAYGQATRVVTAGEDGVVKVWEVSDEGEGLEKGAVRGLEKVTQVMWHGFVEGLIAILCVEAGTTEIQLWDSTSSEEERKRIPLEYSVLQYKSGLMIVVEYGLE
jgi:coronin-7